MNKLSYDQIKHKNPINKNHMQKSIEITRKLEKPIIETFNVITSDTTKESHLIKLFIMESMPSYIYSACKYVFDNDKCSKYSSLNYSSVTFTRVVMIGISILYLLAHFIGISYFLFRESFRIGSQSVNMWLVCVFVTIGLQVTLVFFLKIIVKYVILIHLIIGKKLNKIMNQLTKKSKLIMLRSSGVIRDANSAVQHINLGCRIARNYISLPISRFLLSLSDYDIINYRGIGYSLLRYIPFEIIDFVIELINVITVMLILYGFYQLYLTNLLAFVLVVSILPLIILFICNYDLFYESKELKYKLNDELNNILDMQYSGTLKYKQSDKFKEFYEDTSDMNDINLFAANRTPYLHIKPKPDEIVNDRKRIHVDEYSSPMTENKTETDQVFIDSNMNYQQPDPKVSTLPYTNRVSYKRKHRRLQEITSGPGTKSSEQYEPPKSPGGLNMSNYLMVDSIGPLPSIDFFANVDDPKKTIQHIIATGPGSRKFESKKS